MTQSRGVALAAAVLIFVAGAVVVPPASASTKQFCAAYRRFNLLLAAQFESGVPTPEAIAAVDHQLDARATQVEQAAPKPIARDTATVADVFHSGFASVVALVTSAGSADFADAFYRIDEWAVDHCGYRVVSLTAFDFGFRGLQKRVKPGFVAFRIGNDSQQDHLVGVVRITGDDSLDELAALSLSEILDHVDVIAAPVTAPPGLHVVSYAQLDEPGRYAVLDPNDLAQRMIAEFRVTTSRTQPRGMDVLDAALGALGRWREELRTAGDTWGTTEAERAVRYPVDTVLPDADQWLFRGIDVAAPSALTFRWLCQLRAAPYSYDWIDNVGRASPQDLTPGLDEIEPGQRCMTIFRITDVEPGASITVHAPQSVFGEVAATYRAVSCGAERSRIVVKLGVRYPVGLHGEILRDLLPAGDLFMMRKQLRTLASLAERDAAAAKASESTVG